MILVDTLGELSAVWGLADVAFVGGSLRPGRGGQNMMEPAAFGAAVLFGPHTANFRDGGRAAPRLRRGPRWSPTPRSWPRPCWATSTTPSRPPPGARRPGRYVLAQDGASGRTFAEIDRLVEFAAGLKDTLIANPPVAQYSRGEPGADRRPARPHRLAPAASQAERRGARTTRRESGRST